MPPEVSGALDRSLGLVSNGPPGIDIQAGLAKYADGLKRDGFSPQEQTEMLAEWKRQAEAWNNGPMTDLGAIKSEGPGAAPSTAPGAAPVSKAALTPGSKQQFHGTNDAALVPDGTHYTTKNYYGQGFYTTDAIDMARGYAKNRAKLGGEPVVYGVHPNRALYIYDMEASIPKEVMAALRKDNKGSLGDFLQDALDENPKNLRHLYDTIRDNSTGEGLSADTVQELFTGINDHLSSMGYDGMSHVGGLKTGNAPHKVVIYFKPESDIKIASVPGGSPQAPPQAKAAALTPGEIAVQKAISSPGWIGKNQPTPPPISVTEMRPLIREVGQGAVERAMRAPGWIGLKQPTPPPIEPIPPSFGRMPERPVPADIGEVQPSSSRIAADAKAGAQPAPTPAPKAPEPLQAKAEPPPLDAATPPGLSLEENVTFKRLIEGLPAYAVRGFIYALLPHGWLKGLLIAATHVPVISRWGRQIALAAGNRARLLPYQKQIDGIAKGDKATRDLLQKIIERASRPVPPGERL